MLNETEPVDDVGDRRVPVTVLPGPSPSPLLLLAVVAMTTIGVVAILVIGLFAPDRAAVLIAQVVALLIPTTAALLTLLKTQQNSHALHNVQLSINGRLEQLLRVTGETARAKGNIEGAQKMLDASNLVAAQSIVNAQVPVILTPASSVVVTPPRRKKEPGPPAKEQP